MTNRISLARQEAIVALLTISPRTPAQLVEALGTTKDTLSYDLEVLTRTDVVTPRRTPTEGWLYSLKDSVPALAYLYAPPVRTPVTGTRLCTPSGILDPNRGIRKNAPQGMSSAGTAAAGMAYLPL
jgi:hypothetical protein